jgi:hypothetical protein
MQTAAEWQRQIRRILLGRLVEQRSTDEETG